MTGGLGTACHGLVRSLLSKGQDVLFVMPADADTDFGVEDADTDLGVEDADTDSTRSSASGASAERNSKRYPQRGLFRLARIPPALDPYGARSEKGGAQIDSKNGIFNNAVTTKNLYGGDLLAAVERLADKVREIAQRRRFDVIHAHDWMTFPAGLAAREATGRPLVVHLHSTEFDRCLENVWPPVVRIEKAGLIQADRVIAVSARNKWLVVEKYRVTPEKITVIHNGLNREHLEVTRDPKSLPFPLQPKERVVLFVGRITPQKGPEYFIETAAEVLKTEKNVVFLVGGSGDLVPALVERAAELGISTRILFTGFLSGGQVRAALEAADVFVMPSVSDPFGIACLESMYMGTPAIISNQSGISEMVENVLKTDYWDVEGMAAMIVRLLRDPQYARELASRAAAEARGITWDHPALRCIGLYKEALAERGLEATRD
jgi:glycosyltransferase involved in cell wall biosynthesis